MYKWLILPVLFRFDAEQVHHFVCGTLKFLFKIPGIPFIFRQLFTYEHPALEREVFGLKFKNPVGLAAGFDKNAELADALACLGFGFIEIGTVTPVAQSGNDKPRLFRLKPDRALINRMGFNNEGASAAAERLRKRKTNVLIGGNIGKNKLTPNENALDDYLKSFEALYEVVDYFVVNVSSPNTPGLRDLQEKEPLMQLLTALKQRAEEAVSSVQSAVGSQQPTVDSGQSGSSGQQSVVGNRQSAIGNHKSQITNRAANRHQSPKPILLKIAPDLTESQLDDIIEIVTTTKIAGVIATNTTISRADLATEEQAVKKIGAGGLSGAPLTHRSTEVIRYICRKSNRAFPVIGVGGISSPEDAREKLEAGASLVQIYTGFIYEGPALAKSICKKLV